jgi:calcineurin-like phosphoesterase family protein
MVIERIAKVATKRSQVILHGDEVRSVTALRELVAILAKLPGEFGLLLGNHSPAHPVVGSRGLAAQKIYREAFAWVATSAQQRFAGIEFMSSHFPYEGDHKAEDRYTQFRLRDLGRPIVNGHVHGAWKMKRTATGTPQYNVGVEQYPDRPVNMEELAAMMRQDLALTAV